MIERKKRFIDAAQVPTESNAATNVMELKEPICNLSHKEVMMLEIMLLDDEDSEGCVSPAEGMAYPGFPMGMPMGATYPAPGMPSGNMSL